MEDRAVLSSCYFCDMVYFYVLLYNYCFNDEILEYSVSVIHNYR